MLIGIPAILGPELLFTLRSMGHGDEIALVDGNYPAHEHGRRLIRADGIELIEMLDAILQVMPVDDFVEQALFRYVVKGDPAHLEPVHHEMTEVCARRVPGFDIAALDTTAFYTRVRNAHTVVATSEPRLYANIVIRKGVVRPKEQERS
ncbi:RbsD/FucU family protein [Oryzicola mucosus]|uniref:Transporter n=1 Tax=Oryzicola mucosus TaxID=2767425 RepID=A0A8J6Q4C9_9HYPH|nr:RbsD/FucU domain-containing protein [Oryzicola mucosus]MBD0415970.1 transporter [Oryzicola mucosus]